MTLTLSEVVDRARAKRHLEHGKCSMCDVGDEPYHGLHRGRYKCGNVESCLACHNALPPGEICRACGRKSVLREGG